MGFLSLPVVIIRFLIGKCLGSKRNLKSYFSNDGTIGINGCIGLVAVFVILFIFIVVKISIG